VTQHKVLSRRIAREMRRNTSPDEGVARTVVVHERLHPSREAGARWPEVERRAWLVRCLRWEVTLCQWQRCPIGHGSAIQRSFHHAAWVLGSIPKNTRFSGLTRNQAQSAKPTSLKNTLVALALGAGMMQPDEAAWHRWPDDRVDHARPRRHSLSAATRGPHHSRSYQTCQSLRAR
jgi:hypothetical protein